MNNNLYSLSAFLMLCLLILPGCSNADLSTPENTYDTIHRSIQKKDFRTFASCFSQQNELNSPDNLKMLFSRASDDLVIRSHKVIGKKIITDKEVDLVIEEELERKDIKFRSRGIIKFIKSGSDWKVLSSEYFNAGQMDR